MLYVFYIIGAIAYAIVAPVAPAWHRLYRAMKGTNMATLRARRGYDACASGEVAREQNVKAIHEAHDRVWLGGILLYLTVLAAIVVPPLIATLRISSP
ncbi:MAG: hypothetical protein OXC71_08945 [Chloroflexi bacterium]|nr:hypothetical protein [Chloroflexota bacterium]